MKMALRKTWVCAFIAIALLILAILQVNQRPARASQDTTAEAAQLKPQVSNYDIRDDFGEQARAGNENRLQKMSSTQRLRKAQIAQSMRRAKDSLSLQIPGLEVKLSNAGSAEIVGVESGEGRVLTRGSSEDHEKIVRDFVGRNAALYGLTARQAAQLKKTTEYTNPVGNLSWVELRQEIDGIPVFQGALIAALTKNGELVRTVGRLASSVESGDDAAQNFALLSVDSASDAAAAVSKAAESIGVSINAENLTLRESSPDGLSFIFEPGPFADEIKVEAVYFPLEPGVVERAWSMVLWQDVPAYYSIVGADSGELFWRKNITDEQTQPATFSVYNDDSPAPLSPSTAFPGSGVQGIGIGRTSFTLVSELPAFDNLGWITDGGNTTTGNNVDAGLDISGPNGIDPTGRPIGSPFRVFDFTYNPPPLGADAPAGVDYRAGIVTNLFFWSNR